MLKSIEEVYYIVDEIVQHEVKAATKRGRISSLTISDVITLLIEGHSRGYTTEKQLYTMISESLRTCFNKIPCYVQFTRAIRKAMKYFDLILNVFRKINAKKKSKFFIVDSTSLPVGGYNRNWALNDAGKSKNMHGYYQGFKLHIVVNDEREIVSIETTKANRADIHC